MGGNSEPLAPYVKERHDPTASLEQVLRLGVEALAQTGPDGEPRTCWPTTSKPRSSTAPVRGGRSSASPTAVLERLLGQEKPKT
jgi:hypothetical protein